MPPIDTVAGVDIVICLEFKGLHKLWLQCVPITVAHIKQFRLKNQRTCFFKVRLLTKPDMHVLPSICGLMIPTQMRPEKSHLVFRICTYHGFTLTSRAGPNVSITSIGRTYGKI